MKKIIFSSVLLCILSFLLGSCFKQNNTAMKKELLIYCGTTMLQPVEEISSIFEKEHDCTIRVMAGGSGSLYRSMEFNKVGDLYLPGAESFIQQCEEKQLLTATALVGYNQAVLMVKKSNPLKISSDIGNLANESYSVVLGDPDNGSIGRESKRILEEQGIFAEVVTNSMALVADSQEIIDSIKNGVTDLSMNWVATSQWSDNSNYVETILLDTKVAPRKKLIIGQLIYSKYPELAGCFIDFATSAEGKKIFLSYGFLKPEDMID